MADASSIRKATTLPSATGFYRGGIRWYNNAPVVSTGTQWMPLGNVVIPVRYPVAADAVTQPVFVADRPYQIVSVTETHSATGGTSAAVTVEKAASGVAPGSGILALSATIDLTATANTPVSGSLAVPTTQASGSAVLNTSGGVASISINNGGSGYASVAPIIYISAPTTGGTQAVATANLTGGVVTSVTINTAGAGYDTAPQVLFLNASQLKTGDQLGLVFSGTVTGVDGVLTIVLQPL